MSTDLIIGASGMLSGLCLDLAKSGNRVFALARSAAKLNTLAAQHPNIIPLSCDYTDAAALAGALQTAEQAALKIDRVVCWAHGHAPHVPLQVAPHVRYFYHILSSSTAAPGADDLYKWREQFEALPQRVIYRQIVLGFVPEKPSRWLTHDEICDGIKRVFNDPAALSIIGAVEPWSVRP